MTLPLDASLTEAPVPVSSPRLRVLEAQLDDVETGIVRVGNAVMARMNLFPGDVVVIEGERRGLARVEPLAPHDDRAAVIRMDGLLRENSGVTLDERIRIAPHPVPPAAVLLLAPQERINLGADEVRRIREALAGRALAKGDKVNVALFSRRSSPFIVMGFEPEGAGCLADPNTDVRVQDQGRAAAAKPYPIKYEDIGGLDDELRRIREMIELPIKYPQLFAQLRIEPPKGVLLYGPPGTGKTTIARAVAGEVKAHFIRINGPEIIHKFYGESEAKLRELFEEAQRKAPSIIFIDEIDAIAPKRSDVSGEVEKRVVAQLLALMDGMVSRGEVVVIGATNLPDLLDHALRRPGRFDREVVVRVPNRPGRLQILRIHGRGMPLAADVDLERLAEVTHGFVGADLEVLCKEAGMRALQELLDREDFAERELEDLARETQICMRHFLEALKGIEPTATREFYAERPNVRWSDVGGMEPAKALLRSTVELPRRFPKLYRAAGAAAPSGVILSGAPGSGKTLLVRALATESGFSFIPVDAAALFSKWVGESEKALRQVFLKARQAAPCIVLFDDLDTIFPRRDHGSDSGGRERLIGQFLAEMSNLEPFSEVVVIGATNRLDLVEPGLLNPGRFGFVIELALPDLAGREAVLRIHLRALPLERDVSPAQLAQQTEGFSPAQLATLCRRAGFERLQSFIAAHGAEAEQMAGEFRVRNEDFQLAFKAARLLQPTRAPGASAAC
jgi:transitional endoplasmic reticulum ATPase